MILTIARYSVLEHVRRRIVLFFLVILGLLTLGLIYLVFDDRLTGGVTGAVAGLGVAGSLLFLPFVATIAAIAVSMNNIGRPFSDGEATLVLSRPLTRRQYALGRLLGSFAVIAGLCLATAFLMQVVGFLEGETVSGLLWGHWAVTAFNLGILAAMTTLLSALVNAPVLAGILAYFVYQGSRFVATLYLLVENAGLGGIPAALIRGAWYLTPKTLVSPLLLAQAELAGAGAGTPVTILIPSAGERALWAVGYLAIVILLTFWVVERKDLRS